MNFSDFLAPSAVCLDARVSSQKKLLEKIAQLLSGANKKLSVQAVLDCLSAREKLGSTALGDGVAIPHCRISSITLPVTAVLRVNPALDYNAPDRRKVALFFALLVPEQAPEAHLQILATLAKQLQNTAWTEKLISAPDGAALIALLQKKAETQGASGG